MLEGSEGKLPEQTATGIHVVKSLGRKVRGTAWKCLTRVEGDCPKVCDGTDCVQGKNVFVAFPTSQASSIGIEIVTK